MKPGDNTDTRPVDVPTLIATLIGSSQRAACAAMDVLLEMDSALTIPALANQLQSDESSVRCACAGMLGNFREPAAVAALGIALQDTWHPRIE